MAMPALDPDKLQQLTSYYGEAFLGELAALYLEDSRRLANALAEGLRDRDRQELVRSSHDLKSTSAQMGALELSRVAAEIESASRGSDSFEQIEPKVQEFLALYELVLVEVQSLL